MDQLEYQLEQEKVIKVELMKEVDNSKVALQETQDKVDSQDVTITKVEARIRDLE